MQKHLVLLYTTHTLTHTHTHTHLGCSSLLLAEHTLGFVTAVRIGKVECANHFGGRRYRIR